MCSAENFKLKQRHKLHALKLGFPHTKEENQLGAFCTDWNAMQHNLLDSESILFSNLLSFL